MKRVFRCEVCEAVVVVHAKTEAGPIVCLGVPLEHWSEASEHGVMRLIELDGSKP